MSFTANEQGTNQSSTPEQLNPQLAEDALAAKAGHDHDPEAGIDLSLDQPSHAATGHEVAEKFVALGDDGSAETALAAAEAPEPHVDAHGFSDTGVGFAIDGQPLTADAHAPNTEVPDETTDAGASHIDVQQSGAQAATDAWAEPLSSQQAPLVSLDESSGGHGSHRSEERRVGKEC